MIESRKESEECEKVTFKNRLKIRKSILGFAYSRRRHLRDRLYCSALLVDQQSLYTQSDIFRIFIFLSFSGLLKLSNVFFSLVIISIIQPEST